VFAAAADTNRKLVVKGMVERVGVATGQRMLRELDAAAGRRNDAEGNAATTKVTAWRATRRLCSWSRPT